jgi:hypothetical protein
MAKLFAFFFRSDRMACLTAIKQNGYDAYARDMAEKRMMTIKR